MQLQLKYCKQCKINDTLHNAFHRKTFRPEDKIIYGGTGHVNFYEYE